MNAKTTLALTVLGLSLTLSLSAQAEHHGGNPHVAHFGGNRAVAMGNRHAYAHVGRPAYFGRGYYNPGYYRHGYGHGYGYGRFYGGLRLGVFVSTLPFFYDTYWWGGVPYYYYDNTYYRFNDDVGKYEVVARPSSEEAVATAEQPANLNLFAYPKNGQSDELQKTDRADCHQWAADQTGLDPTIDVTTVPDKKDDYLRAETACLTGRGYSVQ